MKIFLTAFTCAAALAITTPVLARQPIPTVKHLDLQRFMGRWYVIASIPTRMEREGYNAVEHYTLEDNGEICTRFRLRQGGFRQPVKQINSTGEVRNGTGNAEWSIKLFWILHLQYKVAWLGKDYQQVIVARDKRDHVWFMARKPHVSDADYQAMLQRITDMGYDTSKLVKVPQQWPEPYTSPDDEKPESCD
ncbi:MAG: lipocalin family protein [Rhodanobacteraceae bacterium]